MNPVLAITIGDPAGVGPEVSLRALLEPGLSSICRPILVGDPCVLEVFRVRLGIERPLAILQREHLPGVLISEPPTDRFEILDTRTLDEAPPLALPGEAGGRASFAAINLAIDEALAGRFAAVVTAPINKLAMSLAGVKQPGHTEIFIERTNTVHGAMMMYSERLVVGLVTCHQSLASVPGTLSTASIVQTGRLLSSAVERIRGVKPRMAILGLNPHAGESGLFGDEERRLVAPAVRQLEAEGYIVQGPLPPDTAFTPAMLKRHDAHLCLYHDQGLIPFKMISFDDGVNVTMGLPFPRTSVDHGTAYDLAGRGVAEIGSMLAAIRLAAKLASR